MRFDAASESDYDEQGNKVNFSQFGLLHLPPKCFDTFLFFTDGSYNFIAVLTQLILAGL